MGETERAIRGTEKRAWGNRGAIRVNRRASVGEQRGERGETRRASVGEQKGEHEKTEGTEEEEQRGWKRGDGMCYGRFGAR